ncbi:ATP-grasp fold amidoligase family protein [uncultured Shewanella sp.]|uniref:ATP-grasp fold amidoligase family protein n=1 Tax=uncultured Shewanella sp. TaxID=173975 RepID=UPI00260EE6D1|nr:ATP-grasp fold amidoligase family protein [uncultured Shewanella sp.]
MAYSIMKILPDFISLFIRSIACLRYIPNVNNPKTFNEKIQYRKRHGDHELFSLCSDKFEVKQYVEDIIGKECVIENYFSGDKISFDELKSIIKTHGSVVAKLNHDSGSVYLIDESTPDFSLMLFIEELNKSIHNDYGKKSGEPWYSNIKGKILVEKQLQKNSKGEIPDYKFHVFTDAEKQNVILHVDFDRYSNHNRSWFDEDLNYLPFAMGYPNIRTDIKVPDNYNKMVEIAKKLAKPFSYARIDLYNVDGKIYFGEITFAHGSGFERFTTKYHDKWMGGFWKGDLKK